MKMSLKKIILIVIASLAGLVLLVALGFWLYLISQFSVYQDNDYKFSIKYPKTWKVIVHPRQDVAVVFLRPKDTALDTLQENFNVTIQANNLPLAEFTATVKKQMTAVFGSSINIVEDKSIHWAWRQGHKIAINAPKPDHLKMVNAWVFHSDQVIIMTFLGDLNKYAQESFIINEMINSLQIQ